MKHKTFVVSHSNKLCPSPRPAPQVAAGKLFTPTRSGLACLPEGPPIPTLTYCVSKGPVADVRAPIPFLCPSPSSSHYTTALPNTTHAPATE